MKNTYILSRWSIVTGLIILGYALPCRAAKMYWTDRVADTIRRADLDGGQVELLVSGLGEPRGMALDLTAGQMYWADNGTNKIQRASLAGANPEDLVVAGLQFPAGIALDIARGKMYWADTNTGKIQRANLDGSQVEDLVTNLGSPYYVALDLLRGHVFWTDFGTKKIQRANLDGSQVTDLVTSDLSLPRGIALDVMGQKMYWTDRGTDRVQRANLDGTQVETLHTIVPPAGVDAAPHGIALDLARNHMYWLDNGTQKIQRADLDGLNVVDVLTRTQLPELMRPWQIVLDLSGLPCDLNADGLCDVQDIELMSIAIRADNPVAAWDLDANGGLNGDDRRVWVHDRMRTWFGDANLDGEFSTRDLVVALRAGEYEDGVTGNSRWDEGDFNGDGDFDTNDLVVALRDGGYEQGPRRAVVVPEPAASVLTLVGLVLVVWRRCRT